MSKGQHKLDSLVMPAFAIGLQILVLLYATFLYFEGATQATTTGNIGLYDDMLSSAFVLASEFELSPREFGRSIPIGTASLARRLRPATLAHNLRA